MKKIYTFIAVLCGIALANSTVPAADLSNHELYKIVTYSFNNSNNIDETGAVKKLNRFDPLMITRTKADIMSVKPNETDQFTFNTGKTLAQGFAVSADFHATQSLAFRGVIGITKSGMDASMKSTDFDSSWEANLGVVYKLFNNFSYELHFGFMDTGDIFKKNNAYSDVESIVMISNQLTMSF
jgi:hypothetical protein